MRPSSPLPAARPLSGVRVAVTRPADEDDRLSALLREAGAVPVSFPLTRIEPPSDESALREALGRLQDFDWAVFTSARAARASVADWSAFRGRVAAVGPATGSAAAEVTGRAPDVMPARSRGARLAAAMLARGEISSAHVFWPRAEHARPELPAALREAGAVLHDPIAYRAVSDESAAAELVERARAGEIDVITFAAPSAVEAYVAAGPPRDVSCTIAVIGRTTASVARSLGVPVHVEPQRAGLDPLVAALARFYA